MKNIKSSDVQSPLNDQEKGAGFILVKNAVMKNAKGNYHSFSKEKAASTSDESNFFIFLGIAIFLIFASSGPEIMAKLNSKQQEEFREKMKVAQAVKMDPSIIVSGLRKARDPSINRVVLKKFVKNNDSQLLNQLNQNERLLAKLKKRNRDIKDEINQQTQILKYLAARERRRQAIGVMRAGLFIYNLKW